MKRRLVLILAALLSAPAVGHGEGASSDTTSVARARMGDTMETRKFDALIDQATDAYRSITSGPHGVVSARVLERSRCIVVLPSIFTGAMVVGASHGKGVASCKDQARVWSQPVPIVFNQGSIGLQAGAKSADLVLFFQSPEAVAALKRGKFTLSSDVSAVAGTYDSSVDFSQAGVVAFSRAEGLFAGASVNGGTISMDREALKSFYGPKASYEKLLEGKSSVRGPHYGVTLTRNFPG